MPFPSHTIRSNDSSVVASPQFFIIFVLFCFFVVLNIFLAILNDAYTVVHTQDIWDELEKRKPSSLREKFEQRRTIWRERKAQMSKLKVKEEKRKKRATPSS